MYYTILSSKYIQSNSNFDVVVNIYEATELCKIKLSIEGESFSVEKIVEIQPKSCETVRFEIPTLTNWEYKLKAEGLSGLKFEKETILYRKNDENMILIQTDKPVYKPGDLVRIRTLILDRLTRPAKLRTPVKILVMDTSGTTIKKFEYVNVTHGMCSANLQIPSFPVLGNWAVSVLANGITNCKEFKVDKYILPKFEVILEMPENFVRSDKFITGVVKARYTFGKPVKGEVTLRLNPNEKTQDVIKIPLQSDGSASFQISNDGLYSETLLNLTAIAEENLTGVKQEGTSTFKIFDKKYRIESVDTTNYYEGDLLVVKFKVHSYSSIHLIDKMTPLVVTFTPLDEKNRKRLDKQSVFIEKVPDENGLFVIELTEPQKKYSTYHVTAKYPDCHEFYQHKYRGSKSGEGTRKSREIEITPEKPNMGDNISVRIQDNTVDYLFYIIAGYQGILQAGKLEVASGNSAFEFNTKMTPDMYPSFMISAYYIKDGNFDAKREVVNCADLQNFIVVQAPEKAEVGQTVGIEVNTNPNSLIGILGVDKSVKLLKGDNDFSMNGVLSRLSSLAPRGGHRKIGWNIECITNSKPEIEEEEDFRKLLRRRKYAAWKGNGNKVKKERTWFPEIWLWENIQSDESGKITLQKTIPDTITSWILTGFALHPEYGLGLTEVPTNIQAFKTFFATTNLPYSVKRGEVVSIPISVFNYLDTNTEADVTLDNSKAEFEFIDIAEDGSENISLDAVRTKAVQIEKNSSNVVCFQILPKSIGEVSLRIRAKSPLAEDALIEILRVEPEGVTEFINKSVLIKLDGRNEYTNEIELEIPDTAVPDSAHIEVSVLGNLLTSTMENLDQLIRRPCGCGEQNMIFFVPNILVLKYLKHMNMLTSQIEEKIKKHLEIGYQNELNYRRSDNSFSTFGERNKNGITWLTAYVAQSFYQAKEFIAIDESVIKGAFSYILGTQTNEGDFKELGTLFEDFGKSSSGLSMTAFTLLALLEYQEKLPDRSSIEKALSFLEKNIEQESGSHALAVVAYAFQKVGHEKKDIILQKLLNSARRDGDRMWWSNTTKDAEKDLKVTSTDIEITAYALLALLESQSEEHVAPTLKWLISQRNGKGGFISTQDTVVGLTALEKFAELNPVTSQDIQFKFSDDKGTEGQISVNESNSLLSQSHELSSNTRRVKFTATGVGLVLAQISYQFNMSTEGPRRRFTLKHEIYEKSFPDILKLSIFSSFIPIDNETLSNMAVMEVALPSGYIANLEDLEELQKIHGIKLVETAKGDSVVIVYFENLSSEEVCSIIYAYKAYQVEKQKPASIVIYDYYDSSREARMFYEIPQIAVPSA